MRNLYLVFALVVILCMCCIAQARADDPCYDVNMIETGQAPPGMPHGLKGQYYAACALTSQADSERAFNLYLNAAREFSAQGKKSQSSNNPVDAFYQYAKALDIYDSAYLSSRKNGYGDRSVIREQMGELARLIRQVAPRALPALGTVPPGY